MEKNYFISYTTKLGAASLACYGYEVAGILLNMCHLALMGREISNVSVIKM